jgi:hypothetical protein
VVPGDVEVVLLPVTLPTAAEPRCPLVPPLVLWPVVRVRVLFFFAFFLLFPAGWVERTDDVLVAFLAWPGEYA